MIEHLGLLYISHITWLNLIIYNLFIIYDKQFYDKQFNNLFTWLNMIIYNLFIIYDKQFNNLFTWLNI